MEPARWSRDAPVLVTTFRSDPNYPQMVAGVAWIDHTRTRLALYPGRYEPPNDGSQQAQVPPQLRSSLLATFNSGFKLEDSGDPSSPRVTCTPRSRTDRRR